MIIRSHEVQEEGYQIDHDGRCNNILIKGVTIFSAPNYCDTVGNAGAYINISHEMEIEYVKFTAVPHPPVKAMQYASNSMFA